MLIIIGHPSYIDVNSYKVCFNTSSALEELAKRGVKNPSLTFNNGRKDCYKLFETKESFIEVSIYKKFSSPKGFSYNTFKKLYNFKG